MPPPDSIDTLRPQRCNFSFCKRSLLPLSFTVFAIPGQVKTWDSLRDSGAIVSCVGCVASQVVCSVLSSYVLKPVC